MEPLVKQLRQLPEQFRAMPRTLRYGLLGVLALAIAGSFAVSLFGGPEGYQYAFTNLGPEDSGEVATALKAAGIPFRLEANGAAVAVPAAQVYDARLLLASAGLPRGGGLGFELFDRGDLGVSEFTQRINLRRATEGELARTIGHLSGVRSARVHLTLEEHALYREDENHKAAAAVVVNLMPGRQLDDREVAGIRHLVASSVAGLSPEAVTVVDGSGRTLGAETSWAGGGQREIEKQLEQRIVTLLEPVVGGGAVVAKVNATFDEAEVSVDSEAFDPDSTTLRSERKSTQSQSQNQATALSGGVAGAAANEPPGQGAPPAGARGSSSSSEEEVRNYEINKTVTKSVRKTPKLSRLSVAVLLDGVDGKPRPPEEVARLGELAKRAVGFDPSRGDQIEISSALFSHSGEEKGPAAGAVPAAGVPRGWWVGGVLGLLALLVGIGFALSRRGAPPPGQLLRPGIRISEIEGTMASGQLSAQAVGALPNPTVVRKKALEMVGKDPNRAAYLLKAWIAADGESVGGNRG